MKILAQIIAWAALALLVVAPSLFYEDRVELDVCKKLLLTATIMWFVSAPFWMGRKEAA